MPTARRAWIEAQPTLAISTLVFLDETAVPHGHWKTTTFIAGVRQNDVTAPMVLDGPMDGAAFLPSCHKVAGVKEAIEATGATLRFLPPCSPDLNPIVQMFAKLKTLLRCGFRLKSITHFG